MGLACGLPSDSEISSMSRARPFPSCLSVGYRLMHVHLTMSTKCLAQSRCSTNVNSCSSRLSQAGTRRPWKFCGHHSHHSLLLSSLQCSKGSRSPSAPRTAPWGLILMQGRKLSRRLWVGSSSGRIGMWWQLHLLPVYHHSFNKYLLSTYYVSGSMLSMLHLLCTIYTTT